MYLSNKQIDRLNEHNQMLRKSGQKALRHDEVARFFGPEREVRYSFGPYKSKPAHTIGAQYDRAKAGKLGRRERIKPSRMSLDTVDVMEKHAPRLGQVHAKRA